MDVSPGPLETDTFQHEPPERSRCVTQVGSHDDTVAMPLAMFSADEKCRLLTTWRQAELFAAAHMRSLGFEDAQATPLGVDGGIDVASTRAVAQVKHYTGNPVGAPAVQRIRGVAHEGRLAIFYSLTGYTAAATAFAESSGVALFAYDLSGNVMATSEGATRLLDGHHVETNSNLASQSRSEFLLGLETYGQQVSDTQAVVVDYIGLAIERASASPEGLSVFLSEKMGLLDDLRALKVEMDDLGDSRDRPIRHWLDNVIRAESLVQKIATRFDLDYDDFARLAATARMKGNFRNEDQRRRLVAVEFDRPEESTAVRTGTTGTNGPLADLGGVRAEVVMRPRDLIREF